MAFCRNCGAEIHDEAVVCVSCGVAVDKPKQAKEDDKKSGGFAFLCFLVPILGLVLYLLWREDYPLKAKSCAKGAIVGVIISGIFTAIAVIGTFLLSLGSIAFLDNPEYYEVYEEGYEYLMIHLR